MEIEQEILCDYCKGINEFPESFLCEGSNCKESRESYLEDHGITEEKTSFGVLGVGDSIFIIENDTLNCVEIDSVTSNKSGIHFDCGKISVHTQYNLSEHDKDGIIIFLNKKDAIKKYTELMSGRIIFMAETIAGIKK